MRSSIRIPKPLVFFSNLPNSLETRVGLGAAAGVVAGLGCAYRMAEGRGTSGGRGSEGGGGKGGRGRFGRRPASGRSHVSRVGPPRPATASHCAGMQSPRCGTENRERWGASPVAPGGIPCLADSAGVASFGFGLGARAAKPSPNAISSSSRSSEAEAASPPSFESTSMESLLRAWAPKRGRSTSSLSSSMRLRLEADARPAGPRGLVVFPASALLPTPSSSSSSSSSSSPKSSPPPLLLPSSLLPSSSSLPAVLRRCRRLLCETKLTSF